MYATRNGERMELFPPDSDRLRYSFSLAHEDSCQWDEARSERGGVWVTDWVMQFTRRQSPRPLDGPTLRFRRPPESAARFDQTRLLDFLIGNWSGTATAVAEDGSAREGPAVARVSRPMARLTAELERDE